MEEKTINVPFTASLKETNGTVQAYAFDVPGVTVCYGSHGTALKQLKERITQNVLQAVKESDMNYRRAYLIVSNQGTVFTIRYGFGGWGYSISYQGRKDSCGSSASSYEEAIASARKHIDSGFGGIAWEATL